MRRTGVSLEPRPWRTSASWLAGIGVETLLPLLLVGIGLLEAIPLVTALAAAEWAAVVDFAIGMGACLVLGLGAGMGCRTSREPSWTHGLVVAGFSWIVTTAVGAIPH